MGPKANKIAPSLLMETPSWKEELRRAFTSPDELLDFLNLNPSDAPFAILKSHKFPFLVTRYFAGLMRKEDWWDPLLLQVLPRGEEEIHQAGFTGDAVGDKVAHVIPGLLRKYKNRVLLTPTAACAVHCRYCFRREFPYQSLLTGQRLSAAEAYLEEHPEIDEAIFSGGDPMTLDDTVLPTVVTAISNVTSIRRIRFHTRTLSVLPSRVTEELIDTLDELSRSCGIVIVFHINHPSELGPKFKTAVNKLRKFPALLLNQSVLLKDINNSPAVQRSLQLKLLEMGITPYYLHQLDRVVGTHHFEVSEKEGLKIMDHLRTELPGYAVPKYVREDAATPSKTPLL